MDTIKMIIITIFKGVGNITTKTISSTREITVKDCNDKNYYNDLIITILEKQHKKDIDSLLTEYPLFDGTVTTLVGTGEISIGRYISEYLDGLVTFNTYESIEPEWFNKSFKDKDI